MRLAPLPFATLLDALDAAAATTAGVTFLEWSHPDKPAPVQTAVTYAGLRARAVQAAAQLAAQGMGPHASVLMVLPNGVDFLVTFLATQMLGAVPVPLPFPAPFDDPDSLLWTMERIRERTGPAFLVLHPALMERWSAQPEKLAGFLLLAPPQPNDTDNDPQRSIRPPARAGALTPEGLALVQFTSGSTGHPKGVMLTHKNLLANCAAIGQGLRLSPADVGVSWLPLCHDMGLIGAFLSCMCHQVPLVLTSPFEFVLDPLRWLWALSHFGGTISTAPNFGYALCTRARRTEVDVSTLDLSRWRVAMCGAEPVSADTLHAFSAKYAAQGFDPHAIFPVYGLAEASLAVTFPERSSPLHVDTVDRNALSDARRAIVSPPGMPWSVSLVGLGQAVAGHRVRIVDDAGRVRADREVGEICVRGPSVTQGYLHDAEATDAIFSSGWLRTGDLGYTTDGHLYVCGRKKDVIIFRGRKYYPQDLERVAMDVEGVRKGNVVAFGQMDPGGGSEQVTLVLETRSHGPQTQQLEERVRARVQECTGVPVARVVTLAPGELPKTPSGKVRRALCRDRFGLAAPAH